jgi:hypothetical protein
LKRHREAVRIATGVALLHDLNPNFDPLWGSAYPNGEASFGNVISPADLSVTIDIRMNPQSITALTLRGHATDGKGHTGIAARFLRYSVDSNARNYLRRRIDIAYILKVNMDDHSVKYARVGLRVEYDISKDQTHPSLLPALCLGHTASILVINSPASAWSEQWSAKGQHKPLSPDPCTVCELLRLI